MKNIQRFIDNNKKLSVFLVLVILGLVIFVPTAYSHTYSRTTDVLSDYYQHLRWAKALEKHGTDSIPAFVLAHSAWELLLGFLHQTFGLSYERAGFFVTVAFTEIFLVSLFFLYWASFPTWKAVLVILGVGIAAPVSLLWHLDQTLYLGYIGITTYHNPTIILLKPLALFQFIYVYRCFTNDSPPKKWWIIAASLVSVASTFVKPSLAICILPAAATLAGYRLWRKEYLNFPALVFGVGLPTAFVLTWQFLVTYYANETGGIGFAPFAVIGAFSKYLGLKFVLSILFPLSVLIVFYKQVKRDVRMTLGWLLFLFGTLFTYFFMEQERLLEGNFGWSGEITLVLLFAISTLFYLEIPKKTRFESWFPAFFWSLHVIFGIIYYFFCILGKPYI